MWQKERIKKSLNTLQLCIHTDMASWLSAPKWNKKHLKGAGIKTSDRQRQKEQKKKGNMSCFLHRDGIDATIFKEAST